MLNSTVQAIRYDASGVEVQLKGGKVLRAEHVIVTFSLGVLQNDAVAFEPKLPAWKVEAIQSMSMVGCEQRSCLSTYKRPHFVGHLHQDLPPVPSEVLV